MNLEQFGIVIVSKRDAGSLVQYELAFPASSGPETIRRVLGEMPAGSELSVADPANSDCALEVKRVHESFSVKRGCHGAHGTWKPASPQQAVSWLLPGLAHTEKHSWLGQLSVPKNGA